MSDLEVKTMDNLLIW